MNTQNKEHKNEATPLDRAWAAGVFDARVTIPTQQVSLRLQGYDETLLKRWLKVVGVGVISEVKGTMGRTLYQYSTSSLNDSWELIRFVAPLLSARKKKQALGLLRKIERRPVWIKKYAHKAVTLPKIADQDTSKESPQEP